MFGYVLISSRIRVRGPWGPHCHRWDWAARSSSIHWSCSQETRAAETQGQTQGKSAPLNLFHPRKPTHRFLPLISRETTWGVGRKRWHRLWSGVFFFSFFFLLTEREHGIIKGENYSVTHAMLTQTTRSSDLTCTTFFKGSLRLYFELHCQEMQLHSWVFKLILEGSSKVRWTVVTLC